MAFTESDRGRSWLFLREQWTEERVELLKKLWADGDSAGLIAQQLGGISRCAVVGKAHRLKLPGRVTQKTRPQVPKRRQEFVAKTKREIVAPLREVGPSNGGNTLWALKQFLKTDGATDLPPDQSPYAIGLFDVKQDQCRWPLSDPGEGFLFCGAPQWGEHSYCARHFAMARRSPYTFKQKDLWRRSVQKKRMTPAATIEKYNGPDQSDEAA